MPSGDPARVYWRGVLTGGGRTEVPRWTLDPAQGVAGYAVPFPEDMVAAAAALDVPFAPVLFAVHARVLAAVSGEADVVAGWVTPSGTRPCLLTVGAGTWRGLLDAAVRAEADLRTYAGFPVAALRRELGRGGPVLRDRARP